MSPFFQTDKNAGRVMRLTNVGLVNNPALDLQASAASSYNIEADEAVATALAARKLAADSLPLGSEACSC